MTASRCSGHVLYRGPGVPPMRSCTCHYGNPVTEPIVRRHLAVAR